MKKIEILEQLLNDNHLNNNELELAKKIISEMQANIKSKINKTKTNEFKLTTDPDNNFTITNELISEYLPKGAVIEKFYFKTTHKGTEHERESIYIDYYYEIPNRPDCSPHRTTKIAVRWKKGYKGAIVESFKNSNYKTE